LLPHGRLFLTIPRIVCGYLLAFNFGSSKFEMPWSPIDSNLGLFEVAFGSKMLQDMAESLLLLLHFAWMGAFL
jgi:putative oxidoreductase